MKQYFMGQDYLKILNYNYTSTLPLFHSSNQYGVYPTIPRKKVAAELERLEKLAIIEKLDGLTTWLNPIVSVPKTPGKSRICLDMRQENKDVIRE